MMAPNRGGGLTCVKPLSRPHGQGRQRGRAGPGAGRVGDDGQAIFYEKKSRHRAGTLAGRCSGRRARSCCRHPQRWPVSGNGRRHRPGRPGRRPCRCPRWGQKSSWGPCPLHSGCPQSSLFRSAIWHRPVVWPGAAGQRVGVIPVQALLPRGARGTHSTSLNR